MNATQTQPKKKTRGEMQPAQFIFDDLLTATGASKSTLRSYLRGPIAMHSKMGDRPGVRGRNALFTARRLMQVAITHRLTQVGVAPSVGARAALAFTDEAAEALNGSISYDDPREVARRMPGDLFPGDSIRTILWIVRIEDGEPVTRLLAVPIGQFVGGDQFSTGSYTAGVFLDATALANEIEDRLGVPVVGRG